MIFIAIGIVGIVLSGFLSKRYYHKANPLDLAVGSMEGRPFAGAVPLCVSLVSLASFGCLIYGIIKIAFFRLRTNMQAIRKRANRPTRRA